MGLDVHPNSNPNCIATHIDSVTESEKRLSRKQVTVPTQHGTSFHDLEVVK